MTVRVEVLEDPPLSPDGRVDLDRLVARLRRLGPVDVLESAPGNPQTRRWSYVIPHPRTVLLGDVRSVRMARDDAPDEQLSDGPLSALDESGYDSRENVVAARELGMIAFHFEITTVDWLNQELSRVLESNG